MINKNNKKFSFLALIIFTGIAMVLADFFLLFFFGHALSILLSKFVIPALVFFAVYVGVMALNVKCFASGYFQNCAETEYVARLKKIGAVPIKIIAVGIVLHSLFLVLIFFAGNWLEIESAVKTPMFLTTLSFGIFVAILLYVVGDGLVFKTLIINKLTRYPRDLRENRQELKFFIVPIVVSIMTLLFACAVTVLGINQTINIMDKVNGNTWFIVQLPIIFIMFCIVIMALALKKNLSGFYSSIIEQRKTVWKEVRCAEGR